MTYTITSTERRITEKRGRGVEFQSARVWGTLEDGREFNFAVDEKTLRKPGALDKAVAEFVAGLAEA